MVQPFLQDSPFIIACQCGSIETVKYIDGANCSQFALDVFYMNKEGKTGLFYAIESNHK